ncbi:MAG: hypothetical protein IKM31_09195 [Oscillospiraceae bacterium]|nr:hypothetical protein [Oscillospiraceae bacterium]
MTNFSDTVKQKLKYYVYALIDSRNAEVFYIGKGTGDRVFQHETERISDGETEKHRRINDIKNAGGIVEKVIILHGLTEENALAAEAALINLIEFAAPGQLTNIVSGHHAGKVMAVEDIERFYGAKTLTADDIHHNLLVIKINRLYSYGMSDAEIMDCARGHWVISTERASKTDYLLAVYHGIVVGVYENMQWHSSANKTDYYPHLSEETLAMTNRHYCTCTPVSNSEYLGKNIGALVRDAQNPISYIWRK